MNEATAAQVDGYLWDYWGDSPNLAITALMADKGESQGRNQAAEFCAHIVAEAEQVGVVLRPEDVAERATRALTIGEGWRGAPVTPDAR